MEARTIGRDELGAGTGLATGASALKCTTVQSADQRVVVCAYTADSNWLQIVPSIVLSAVALLVSVRTFFYNQAKDDQARTQSIQDDFWLRKVVSPASIEPFLKFKSDLTTSLPNAAAGAVAVEGFWTSNVQLMQGHVEAFRSLQLIDSELAREVENDLTEIEEILATYCGLLLSHLAQDGRTPTPPSASEASRQIGSLAIRVLARIQRHQAVVGTSVARRRPFLDGIGLRR
jgi:hypothetical protein